MADLRLFDGRLCSAILVWRRCLVSEVLLDCYISLESAALCINKWRGSAETEATDHAVAYVCPFDLISVPFECDAFDFEQEVANAICVWQVMCVYFE